MVASIIQESEVQFMQQKRVYVYTSNLAPYIEAIKTRIRANSDELRRFAEGMTPSYPYLGIEDSDERLHVSQTSMIAESAIREMQKNIANISDEDWKIAIQEYVDLPERSSGKEMSKQEGVEFAYFYPSLIELMRGIGEEIEKKGIKIPYFYSGKGEFSTKAIMNIAIIWLGRRLKQESDNSANG